MHRIIARRGSPRPERTPGVRRGATLIELTIALTLVVVALGGFSRALSTSLVTVDQHAESSRALEAARQMVERLQATPFDEVFTTFAGQGFAVERLQAVAGDADGLPGELVFPTVEAGGALELREDVEQPLLGMPRDLDGDGLVDGEDHAAEHDLLPVIVRVRWRSPAGEARVELSTLLADLGV